MTTTRLGAVAALLALMVSAGCTGASARSSDGGAAAPTSARVSTGAPTTSTPAPTPPIRLVRWHGPVEELFVHPLVINPRLAFTSDDLGVGFERNFVTALEFRRILDQLWRNGWTLVDIHRAANGTVRVPAGRRPLVFSEDDVNYYGYFHGRGLATRLVLDHGRVLAKLPNGRLSTEDVVPLIEDEVARHPEFSADGAKGVLALTGYEGLLGEHHPERPAAQARLKALAGWFRTHGWTIASHTWGHIDLSTNSAGSIAWDTMQWKKLAQPIFGPTDIVIYPFGARPDPAARQQLVRAGYKIQLDIDIVARRVHEDGAVIMSRRHIDGYAFDVPRRQARFFDVATVRDPARPR